MPISWVHKIHIQNSFGYPIQLHAKRYWPACIQMAATTSTYTFCFLLVILISCSSGIFPILVKNFEEKELRTRDDHPLPLSRKELVENIRHDFANPSVTPYPTTPITNPVTTPITNPVTTPTTITAPPGTSSPATVTIPSVNPNPVNPALPITNPVTTPGTTYPGSGQPVSNTNPGATYPNPTVPVVAQPVTTANAPAIPGQSWCVARSGVAEANVQAALDYACGIGGADCASIQQGGSCYNPNTMQNHASYAFNSYYQRNPVQTSCDFGGTAFITNMNPSSGSCIYPVWSSSSALPNTVTPITTNPTSPPTTTNPTSTPTTTSPGATPVSFPTGTPTTLGGAATGYGVMPAMANTSSTSVSIGLQPLIGCVAMVTSIITWKLVLDK